MRYRMPPFARVAFLPGLHLRHRHRRFVLHADNGFGLAASAQPNTRIIWVQPVNNELLSGIVASVDIVERPEVTKVKRQKIMSESLRSTVLNLAHKLSEIIPVILVAGARINQPNAFIGLINVCRDCRVRDADEVDCTRHGDNRDIFAFNRNDCAPLTCS